MSGTAWLTALDVEDIEITSIALESGVMKLHRAHPEECDMWYETMDLLDDLHASWEVVWTGERLRS